MKQCTTISSTFSAAMHVENICEPIHRLHSRQVAAKFCSRRAIASTSFACISAARSASSRASRRGASPAAGRGSRWWIRSRNTKPSRSTSRQSSAATEG